VPNFYVQGIAPGFTKLIVSGHGYAAGGGTLAVYKAGFTLFTPSTQYLTGILGGSGQANGVGYLSLLDPYSQSWLSDCTGLTPCSINPGTPASTLTLVPDDPTIGTFGPSSTNSAIAGAIFVPFTPLKQGQTNYSLGTQSAGFYNTTTPSRRQGIASVTVTGSAGLTNALYVTAHDIDAGVGVEVVGNWGLSATVIGYFSATYTIAIADPTVALVSLSPTVAGSGSVSETTLAYINNDFYVQGLKAGSTTITISGGPYISRTVTVTVRPAGFVFKQFDYSTRANYEITGNTFTPAVLNDVGQWMANAQISPQNTTASVQISSSNPGVASVVTNTIQIPAGATYGTFTLLTGPAGAATLTLGAAASPLIQPTTYQSLVVTTK
jgi:hypothetical protein